MGPSENSLFHFGVFDLDLSSGELRKAGALIKLQPQPFKVLALLVRRAGQVVTREEIQQEIWHGEAFVDFERGLRYEDAIAEFRKAVTLARGFPSLAAALAHTYALAGKRVEARRALDQLNKLSKRTPVDPFQVAVIYAGLGQKDQAFQWLEKAYEHRRPNMITLKVEPRWIPCARTPGSRTCCDASGSHPKELIH